MPIRQLPTLLINQIAAGEVIERPASVVKELVENALDAGSTHIEVNVEQGGGQLIRIADNGSGITEEDLPLAVAPHATSKLQSADQLEAIATLGFRGEALASIASISRLKITTRPMIEGRVADAALCLEVAGDDVSPITPAAAAPGTVVEVRDLFFNTPARRKFMRTASTEFGHINETLTRIALVWPHVAFKLTHNDRKALDLPADQSRRSRCVQLLGKELDDALLEFDQTVPSPDDPERPGMTIWGLAGLPSIARATAKFQYLCLNGRPVKDRNLSHAIKEAYRGLIPPDRQPVIIAFLDLDPAAVDVNVHPAKAEVRFRNPSAVHRLVFNTLRNRLQEADLTPAVTFNPNAHTQTTPPGGYPQGANANSFAMRPQGDGQSPALPGFSRPPQSFSSGPYNSPHSGPSPSGHNSRSYSGAAYSDGSYSGSGHTSQSESPDDVRAFVDYFRQMDPRQKGFAYQQVREALQEHAPDVLAEKAKQAKDDESTSGLSDIDIAAALAATFSGTAGPVTPGGRILQVHNSYIVTQDDEGLLIVDQHALHERVMFEELRKRVLAENLESQRLLMPAVLSANASRQSTLESLAPLLERIGIEAEPMGPTSVAVHAFPSFLFDRKVDPVEFLDELIDKAEEGAINVNDETVDEAALHEVLDMMSCKAAVKAGDKMSMGELESLLARREEIERSSNCPHGRPTTIRLSLRDLEKRFGRT